MNLLCYDEIDMTTPVFSCGHRHNSVPESFGQCLMAGNSGGLVDFSSS